MNRKKGSQPLYFYRKYALVLLFMLLSVVVFARVGGAGGDGGGGDGGIFELIFYVLFLIPFPYNIMIIGVIIIISFIGRKKARERSVLNRLNASVPTTPIGQENFLARNPGFQEEAFREKVGTAFTEIQNAWSIGNMGSVRRYISDGVYQRFNTQLKMMHALDLVNKLEKLELLTAKIHSFEADGEYDVVHVAISGSLKDKLISKRFPQLNTGGSEAFWEYWTFIRKNGVSEANIYSSANCPQCGGALPKNMGDIAKCEFCGCMTTTGDYDWVLCEITQPDDFAFQNKKTSSNSHTKIRNIRNVLGKIPGFSIQHIEDKVANGFLQIQTARVLKDENIMRRFVTEKCFEKLASDIKKEPAFFYYRIYLNDVSVNKAKQNENMYYLSVAVKMSYQRVAIENDKIRKIDCAIMSDKWIVNLVREANQNIPLGSLYAYTCPSCGGALSDTSDTNCPWCGSTVNSPANEWIIASVVRPSDASGDKSETAGKEKQDDLLDVRDYAFNNVAVMVAADDVVTAEERTLLMKLAKRWGYNVSNVEATIQLAINQKLPIRMPEDVKKRRKIFELMERAAKSDGVICEKEREMLDSIRREYLP